MGERDGVVAGGDRLRGLAADLAQFYRRQSAGHETRFDSTDQL